MIIYGQNVQLWVDGKTIAFAKTASFNITANEVDCSTKDSGGYENIEIGLIGWEMTSENLVGNPRSGLGYDDLFDLMLKREKIEVIYGLKDELTEQTETYEVPATDGWTKPNKSSYYKGNAYITSLSNTSANGEVVTFSVTLKGCSKLEHVKATSTGSTAQTMSLKTNTSKA